MINLFKLHSNPEQLYGYDRMTATPKLAWVNINDDQKKKLESFFGKWKKGEVKEEKITDYIKRDIEYRKNNNVLTTL